MTIINPNSISGIVSVTATSNALHFYESDGDKLNINADLTGNVTGDVTGNVTGNVTGTTATFSGDVTVGGVLTYDDVTNVDSVGLGTFRNGLHVTGGSVAIGTDTGETNFLTTINGDLSLGEKNGVDNTFIDQKQNGSLEIINSGRNANNGSVRINRYNNISGDTTYFRDFVVYDGKETALLTVDGSTSNIGIGTDNPAHKLHISGTDANLQLRVTKEGVGSFNHGVDSTGAFLETVNTDNIPIRFYTGGSERLRITSAGLVGIGTDNPTESKIVIGHTQTSTVKHLAIKDLTNNWVRKLGVDSSNNFGIFSGDTEHLRITGIGSVGISSTAPKTDVDISQKTGAVALPQGTTAQRPTGSAPYIRKNTTNNALEYFDGTSWVEIITDYFPTGSVIFG